MSSTIDVDAVRALARLARVAVRDADLPALAADVARIMEWIDVLAAADLDDEAPLESVVGMTLRPVPDAARPAPGAEAITRHAALARDGMFVAPRATT